MRDIYLHGPLGERFGTHFRLDVKSPAEAAHALCKLLDGFREAFVGADYQQRYRVESAGFAVTSGEHSRLQTSQGDIHFTPVIAGGAGLLQTILGITLIVAGTFIPGAQALIPAGIAMTIGGVVSLLSPTPKAQQNRGDQQQNNVFDGPVNVSAQGATQPVALGKGWFGSVVISAGIDSVQSAHVDFDPDNGIITDGPGDGDDADDTNHNAGNHPEAPAAGGGYNPYGPRGTYQAYAPVGFLQSGSGRSTAVAGGADIVLRGAKGGGKGGGGVKQDGISARSTAVVRVLDFVSFGPVGGPVDELQSTTLNKVPIENADQSTNYIGQFAWRTGTQDQAYIPDFPDVESEVSVAADVQHSQPVTHAITDPDADRARVRLRWAGGMQDSSSGKRITASHVDVQVELQSNGGGFVPVVVTRVDERTQANYERSWEFELTGDAPWAVRVSRLSKDEDSALVVNAFRWESLTTIIDAKLRYPRQALFGSVVPSGQFGNVPDRAFFWWGHLAPIPKNYDPIKCTYATTGPGTTNGMWDGTFKVGVCENPAWIQLLLCENKLWGAGDYIGRQRFDKWSLYNIAQRCDEMVSDGKGGKESRWSFFAYLTKRQAAWQVLDMVASAFRGHTYWMGGQIVPTQDAPGTPVYTYTAANVIDGRFHRQGASLDTKFTRVIAYYHDDEQQGARVPVVVDDAEGIRRYGIITKEVDSYSRSPGQAARFGRSILITNLSETDVVTWAVGTAGAVRAPGEIVDIFDNARAKTRRGGRLDAATADTVTLDSAVAINDGTEYTLILVVAGQRIVRRISNAAGIARTLTVTQPFDKVPAGRDTVWVLASDDMPAEWLRLTKPAVENGDGTFQLTGTKYNGDKYAYIDSAGVLPSKVKGPIQRPAAVTGLTAVERMYTAADGSTKLIQSLFSWDSKDAVTHFEVTLSSSVDTAETRTTQGHSLSWLNIEPGVYTLTIVAMSGGLRGIPTIKTFNLDGKNAPDADFVVDNRRPTVGQSVAFTDKSSELPSAWSWDFGDSTTSAAQSPTHTYQNAGTYDVALTATNKNGSTTETRTAYITVGDVAPVAGFSVTKNGRDVTITDQHTGGTVTSYKYDFGDGSTSSDRAPQHSYADAGTYTIKQTVTGPKGTDSTTDTITIS